MSATGRGERGGGGSDFFPTPAWCVDWLLRAVDLPGGWWLEPSAGDGAIIRAVNARRSDISWTALEVRPEAQVALTRAVSDGERYGEVECADFMSWAPIRGYRVVLGNCPYAEAGAHVAKAIALAPAVAMLLRLNFLGSQKRAEFWRRHPADVYVLSERPSFDGEGTDATEYAWFVWGQCGSRGRIQVLGPDSDQLPLLAGIRRPSALASARRTHSAPEMPSSAASSSTGFQSSSGTFNATMAETPKGER